MNASDCHHPPQLQPRRRSPSPNFEVLRCTSNASFKRNLSMQRKSALLKAKTCSRLIDPHPLLKVRLRSEVRPTSLWLLGQEAQRQRRSLSRGGSCQ
ncbi:hypothetical protein Fmac_008531 [Flemingia macrophylla]|uniref:Uncharacterized protein n=1 Tax=Flemingia macrophylla TaxID=520843 RepID=A0ABD1MY69_9FABA